MIQTLRVIGQFLIISILPDDLYQLLTYLPDEVPYNCRICCPVSPSPWEKLVKDELYAGFVTVCQSLLSSKMTSQLARVEEDLVGDIHDNLAKK